MFTLHACWVNLLEYAGTTATGTLTCPIQLSNTGNVGLQNINLQSPSTACTAAVLEPNSPPKDCTVTLASNLGNFEQGAMVLSVVASATPRGAGAPTSVSGTAQSVFTLEKVYEVSTADALAVPTSVNGAGMLAHCTCHGLRARVEGPICIQLCRLHMPGVLSRCLQSVQRSAVVCS